LLIDRSALANNALTSPSSCRPRTHIETRAEGLDENKSLVLPLPGPAA
jgi:hypothetical protein